MAMTIMRSSIYSCCCITSSFSTQKSLLPPAINFPSHFNSSSSRVSTSSSSKIIIVPKLSETQEAPSISVESPIIEQVTKTDDEPKGQEVFAVVMIGGRQYIVFPGRFLYTQRLKGANVDDKIILNKVLLVGTKTSTYIGKPIVPNAAVHAVVEEQGLDPKVVVFKYKKKKNYRRNIGHRQPNTRIRILGITGYQDSPSTTLD